MPDTSVLPYATAASIEGSIDQFTNNVLYLWCRDVAEPERAVLVDVLVNDQLFGRFAAKEHRPDLEAAGKGTGNHGLTVDFNGSSALPTDMTVVLAACAADTPGVPFATIELAPKLMNDFELQPAVIEHLGRHLPRLVNEAYEDGLKGWGPAGLTSLDDKAASPVTQLMTGGNPRVPISKYGDFVRHRFRMEDQFNLGQASAEAANFLKWYLESYCVLRGAKRAPLAAAEINYLNELVVYGGQSYSLSRVTWMFLLDNPDLLGRLNLNSAQSYLEVVYWWAIERSRSLWVEDCLVHSSYRQALSTVAERWRVVDYPLSQFMEVYFNHHDEWHFLNFEYESDRAIYYIVLLLSTLAQPTLQQYMPRIWLRRLLQVRSGGESAIGRVLSQVMPDSPGRAYLSDFRQALASRGYDVDRQKSLALTIEGHRVANLALRPEVQEAAPVPVQIIGPLQKASGLGQATRMSYDAMLPHFPGCSAYDFDIDNPAPVGFNAVRQSSQLRRARINLIHLNAESIPLAYAFLPDVFSGSYNIGYFFWELDSPASCHSLALDLLDEIWVSSRYGVAQYERFASIPVINVGMCFEDVGIPSKAATRAYRRTRLGMDETCFVFFAAFDSFSFVQRKNPQAVVRAFLEAFPGQPNIRLVLKTHNRDFVNDPVQRKIWQLLDEAVAIDPRITIINETLPYDELLLLKASCDCYVSLHRSEGWGFGMIEAMHLGVAVLATNYSGNTEFCSPETAWLVDYQLRPMAANEYIFVRPGQVWAEPDHADAVRQMREVVSNGEARAQRSDRAKVFVDTNFSPAAIGQRYADRLAAISLLGVPPRNGPPVPESV